MSWIINLVVTNVSDGSPAAGIAIVNATPEGEQLATTDAAGAATVTLDVDTSAPRSLVIAGTRFSVRDDAVVLHDQQVYNRITAGQPPYPEPTTSVNVAYSITDSVDQLPVIGIALTDALTLGS
jgi:hypothetical protein